ncbi:DotU family type IV/VI secretion system protein [Candidatus Paracaedibacter symbiosus]|uniref:DotU family type IV/VI secretion system protein n=1 Tax=Candidatus Paracaedibacter symbiosus TaxID=244582 RepID=UPI0005097039|nr:DotU family type IV/VI secretion system protein [Candidatus Paracaedibacter symbiosus]
MDILPASSTFLMQNFQEFYREVLIQKEKAFRTLDALNLSIEGDDRKAEIEGITDRIQTKFRQLFERFSLNAQNQVGEFAISHFQEALYVMVSLVDEVFLSFTWPGQKRWENNLIEAQVFHTQVAGEQLYKKLDSLIEANDAVRNDLAMIYLMALSLGFRGRYRGENDAGKIVWYRQQLYAMVNRHGVTLYHPGRERLIPALYEYNVTAASSKGLPDLRTWFMAFGVILFVFLFVASMVWYNVVRDLDGVIGQILSQAQKLGIS